MTRLSKERIVQNNKCFTVGPKINQLFLLTATAVLEPDLATVQQDLRCNNLRKKYLKWIMLSSHFSIIEWTATYSCVINVTHDYRS